MNNKYKSFFRMTLSLGLGSLLSGCKQAALLYPKGMVGRDERDLIFTALGLMLIVVIPVIIMTVVFAWKYRASNTKATYAPDWHHSSKIEAVVWGIPIIIIAILATITWKSTHDLDPYKPLEVKGAKPLTIEVVALNWKWLFIYPEQNIATINFVQFPKDVPVDFKITADAPMNSFMIPQLGGQVYAMAGMQTHLHLIGDSTGDYDGRAVNYNGHGFSDMTFVARVSSEQGFRQWVDTVRQSENILSAAEYNKLVMPSQDNPVKVYSSVQNHLYDNIIMKFMMPGMDNLAADHSSMMMHM